MCLHIPLYLQRTNRLWARPCPMPPPTPPTLSLRFPLSRPKNRSGATRATFYVVRNRSDPKLNSFLRAAYFPARLEVQKGRTCEAHLSPTALRFRAWSVLTKMCFNINENSILTLQTYLYKVFRNWITSVPPHVLPVIMSKLYDSSAPLPHA